MWMGNESSDCCCALSSLEVRRTGVPAKWGHTAAASWALGQSWTQSPQRTSEVGTGQLVSKEGKHNVTNVKWYKYAQPLDDGVSPVPFSCLVVLATWFITTPSMPFWMSGGDAETRLNSSQRSVIFCSTLSSSAARPARSISFTQATHGHGHAVRFKVPKTTPEFELEQS